jgi:hypothetical protein
MEAMLAALTDASFSSTDMIYELRLEKVSPMFVHHADVEAAVLGFPMKPNAHSTHILSIRIVVPSFPACLCILLVCKCCCISLLFHVHVSFSTCSLLANGPIYVLCPESLMASDLDGLSIGPSHCNYAGPTAWPGFAHDPA